MDLPAPNLAAVERELQGQSEKLSTLSQSHNIKGYVCSPVDRLLPSTSKILRLFSDNTETWHGSANL